MWLYEEKPVKVSYNTAKYGGHRHSGIRDIMVFAFPVAL